MNGTPAPATSLVEEHAANGTVLLVIDMFSTWDFRDAERVLAGAERIAPAIAALRRRCRRAGVPVIYANDNAGRWRSDFRDAVRAARESGGAGARIAELLAPQHDDYFVLKPKHSAFFGTPLDLLLRHLRASRLILTGVSSDQCVVFTAAGARMHDYEVLAPRDCIASQDEARGHAAVEQLSEVMGLDTRPTAELCLPGEGEEGGG
jgi:nicotinamidase-related amidase